MWAVLVDASISRFSVSMDSVFVFRKGGKSFLNRYLTQE